MEVNEVSIVWLACALVGVMSGVVYGYDHSIVFYDSDRFVEVNVLQGLHITILHSCMVLDSIILTFSFCSFPLLLSLM